MCNDKKSVSITHLEMVAKPDEAKAQLADGALVLRAFNPTISFYRHLYDSVGERWQWRDRRQISDDALAQIIRHPSVEIWVLHIDGVPAGYGELDRRQLPSVELSYFGLMPEFIGRRLGRQFLRWIVCRAWESGVSRLWVHTCNLDHPRALQLYRETGFASFNPAQGEDRR